MGNPAIWIAIFALGLLGLNWPVLSVAHDGLVLYLHVFWLLFVLLVAVATRGPRRPPPEP
jgi:hypothetical protein